MEKSVVEQRLTNPYPKGKTKETRKPPPKIKKHQTTTTPQPKPHTKTPPPQNKQTNPPPNPPPQTPPHPKKTPNPTNNKGHLTYVAYSKDIDEQEIKVRLQKLSKIKRETGGEKMLWFKKEKGNGSLSSSNCNAQEEGRKGWSGFGGDNLGGTRKNLGHKRDVRE